MNKRHPISSLISLAVVTNVSDPATGGPADAPAVSPIPIPEETRERFVARELGAHTLADHGHRVWGLSVIRWTDGKYHGYYARWPDDAGHSGWLTHCEIAHAVADRPEGPFRFVNIALSSRNVEGWDIVNSHNPYAIVAGGRVCLYYISNKLRGQFEPTAKNPYPSDAWLRENRYTVRNAQCIGVAIADDPAGPFVRSPDPVVEPHGLFKNIAVNPSVVYHDNRFLMIMKGDDVRKEGWFRIQLAGSADKPDGPFTFNDKPVYAKAQTEDAGMWYDHTGKRYNMVCHVMGKRDLRWFVSEDGMAWRTAPTPVFIKKSIPLDDGTVWKPQRVERPFVLTDDTGTPTMLYVAVADGDINGNIAIPLDAHAPDAAIAH